MELAEIAADLLDALATVDVSGVPFKDFRPGVGPYGEPQLVKLIAQHLNHLPKYGAQVVTRRTPDLLITDEWGLEFKIARPFGDNGMEAENWSVNLLHPYRGNVSTIGDCFKLLELTGIKRRAVVVIGYEHIPPKIDLSPLVDSFEIITHQVMRIRLSPRVEVRKEGLVHPVHQAIRIFAWEVMDRAA